MLIRSRIRYRFSLAFQRHERMSGSPPFFILIVITQQNDANPHSRPQRFPSSCTRADRVFDSSVYSFSDGETCLKYRYRALKTDATANPAVRNNPIIFCFSPCLRDSLVQRSCLWLRSPHAVLALHHAAHHQRRFGGGHLPASQVPWKISLLGRRAAC